MAVIEPSANFHVSFFDGFFTDFRRFYLSSCAKEISSKTWIIHFSRKHLDLFSPTHSLLPSSIFCVLGTEVMLSTNKKLKECDNGKEVFFLYF